MGTCGNRRRSKLDLKSHGVAGARDRCWMYRCGVASAQRVSVLLSVFDCLFATNEQKKEQERGLHWSMGFGAMSGIEVSARKILGLPFGELARSSYLPKAPFFRYHVSEVPTGPSVSVGAGASCAPLLVSLFTVSQEPRCPL